MKRKTGFFQTAAAALLVPAMLVSPLPSMNAQAATTDLSNTPLASSQPAPVKPNIMFILDDSGSMSRTFMPDSFGDTAAERKTVGYKNHLCNRLYYNPDYNPGLGYVPPVQGVAPNWPNYADSVFTNAWDDGFNAASVKINLSTASFTANSSDTDQKAYYYKFNGAGTPTLAQCNEANSSTAFPHSSANFTKVQVTSTSGPGGTDERTNFANWYSYYRTRINMARTAAGIAFKGIGDSYRIGFTVISDKTVAGTKFLKIGDFTDTQKTAWYDKLYTSFGGSFTPLRAALSKAGRIYAGKLLTGADDPVQYSCQKNFTILSTDGYWNTNLESASYGPDQVDGTTNVGNQDGAPTPRPMLDGLNKADTLADVAMYYYATDLRPAGATGALGTDVSENNVKPTASDAATYQHMMTFTIGFGVDGTLGFADDYKSGGSVDYNAIIAGTKDWPDPTVTEDGTRIDDLWHAAVNGHGTYFSGRDPEVVVKGLRTALKEIADQLGAGAAAALSSAEPVAGDNFAWVASYASSKWEGNFQKFTVNPLSGAISATAEWSAQSLLDNKVSAASDTRTIYTFDSGTASKLKEFTWANLTAAEKTYFAASGLTQWAVWDATKKGAATGETLVNFVRGQSGYEDQTSNDAANRLYRDRSHVLGDIVQSSPVYVKQPPFSYTDAGYSAFKTGTTRSGTVYVGGNDGMLHAFSADDGQERWAYVPSAVMPNLYKLADADYAAMHQYYVDGTPTVSDAYIGGQWRTILVGGLNKGGRGYYALDITDPASPKALWEYTVANDSDLGFSYGRPVVAKRTDGTWVVMVTSGYNNVSPGDGKGYLYVLDAASGTKLEKIGTGAGSTTTPSGLGKIGGWIVDLTLDNTVKRVYGGDLLGNLWRFDIDDVVPPGGKEALLLAEFQDASSKGQPITTEPELGIVKYNGANNAVVYVGTGRYLGTSDLSDLSQQSLYAVKDDLTASAGVGIARTSGKLVQQTLSANPSGTRTVSSAVVDWATKSGWFVDFNPGGTSPGERVFVDPKLVQGQLLVATGIPNLKVCTVGGSSWFYIFDYKNGIAPSTSPGGVVGEFSASSMVTGVSAILAGNGQLKSVLVKSDGTSGVANNPPVEGFRRTSWRELLD